MRKFKHLARLLYIIIFSVTTLYCNDNNPADGPQAQQVSGIKLPPGFRIDVFAENINNARSMTLADNGVVFVGTRSSDKVYAVVDGNNDGKADEVLVVAEGLNTPNGVAIKDGDLYVAEISKVWRYPGMADNFRNPPAKELVNDQFPTNEHHGWKFIAFGPDDKLYVPVGAPCNVCLREDERFSSIMRMNADGSGLEVFAHGIRNTVGFDWHPETDVLYFTDNGRDMMGDNIPPDELNKAPEADLHFGFPYMHGNDVPDPDFGDNLDPSKYQKPIQELGPHVAALGMRFYTGSMFPEEYKNQIFIAEHGSWNRSEKIGYRVMLVKLENGNAVSYTPFAEGWLNGESVSGRPVDVLVMPDGALLVSDDYADKIYRISYQP